MEAAAGKTKVELREQMRARLDSLSPAQVRTASAAVWERLSVLAPFASAEWLLAYVSIGHEVDTQGLIRQLLALGKRLCVPKFDEAGQRYVASELLDFDSELAVRRFKILEPKPEVVRHVESARIDALLVPGLAFDKRGNRLGRGMGFFDAILRDARGAKIALAHDFQVVSEVPVEPHDVGVDFIVTEARVVETKRN
jgi:5-formyltetrahydrofolate cyclo-ligase